MRHTSLYRNGAGRALTVSISGITMLAVTCRHQVCRKLFPLLRQVGSSAPPCCPQCMKVVCSSLMHCDGPGSPVPRRTLPMQALAAHAADDLAPEAQDVAGFGSVNALRAVRAPLGGGGGRDFRLGATALALFRTGLGGFSSCRFRQTPMVRPHSSRITLMSRKPAFFSTCPAGSWSPSSPRIPSSSNSCESWASRMASSCPPMVVSSSSSAMISSRPSNFRALETSASPEPMPAMPSRVAVPGASMPTSTDSGLKPLIFLLGTHGQKSMPAMKTWACFVRMSSRSLSRSPTAM
mmetsp:Transcript_16762/g.47843  ORF Transcript_16762/g.47843 Transcript_16762/m.47843 type:complete len:294 (-) Transcript_16762:451-1332(-)